MVTAAQAVVVLGVVLHVGLEIVSMRVMHACNSKASTMLTMSPAGVAEVLVAAAARRSSWRRRSTSGERQWLDS